MRFVEIEVGDARGICFAVSDCERIHLDHSITTRMGKREKEKPLGTRLSIFSAIHASWFSEIEREGRE